MPVTAMVLFWRTRDNTAMRENVARRTPGNLPFQLLFLQTRVQCGEPVARVAGRSRVDGEQHQVMPVEAGVHAIKISQRPHEQTGAEQQNELPRNQNGHHIHRQP